MITALKNRLKNKMKISLKDDKGMTLLEIMIVVIILASLMAILGRNVLNHFRDAKVKEAKIQIGEIEKSLDMYYTDCGHYPTTSQGLAALAPGGASTCKNWGPDPYLNKVPTDPWGNSFVYSSQNGSYILKSLGSDGKPGGTGDAADISSQNL